MARMKLIGDSGLPCLNPRPCWTGLPISPLKMILDVVVRHNTDSMPLHFCLKPNVYMSSIRYSHHMLANGFTMWSFKNSIRVLA
jgi:hypothetical protein